MTHETKNEWGNETANQYNKTVHLLARLVLLISRQTLNKKKKRPSQGKFLKDLKVHVEMSGTRTIRTNDQRTDKRKNGQNFSRDPSQVRPLFLFSATFHCKTSFYNVPL